MEENNQNQNQNINAQDIKNIVLTDNLAGIVYRDKIEFINL